MLICDYLISIIRLNNMIEKTDAILIGGALAFTFLKVQGKNVGSFFTDNRNLQETENILRSIEKSKTNLVLPVDVVAARNLSHDTPWRVVNIEELETNMQNAPMSGLTLFSLTAKITHPELDYNMLTQRMDALASELDVNIIVED